MNEQEEFLSLSHIRLMNVAIWARYIAWVVLFMYVLWAVLQIFQYQNIINSNDQVQWDFWSFIMNNPFEGFRLLINMLATVLKGIVYYLVLKGISLGLNMIVETNINYRQQKQAKVA